MSTTRSSFWLDIQMLTTHFGPPGAAAPGRIECSDGTILACGVNPDKAVLFIQSMVPQIGGAHCHLLQPGLRSSSSPTTRPSRPRRSSTTSKIRCPWEFLSYPDQPGGGHYFCRAHLVPVGEDQAPHIEQTPKRIVRKFSTRVRGCAGPNPEGRPPTQTGWFDGNTKMRRAWETPYSSPTRPTRLNARSHRRTDPARIHPTDKATPTSAWSTPTTGHSIPRADPKSRNAQSRHFGCVPCKKLLGRCPQSFPRPDPRTSGSLRKEPGHRVGHPEQRDSACAR